MPVNLNSECSNEREELRPLRPTGEPIGEQKHKIEIIEVMNGFKVIVGCKTLVFETREKLLSELKRYLENRKEVEKEYLEKYK